MHLLTSLILFVDGDDLAILMSGSSKKSDNKLDIFLDYNWKL